jgi:Tfp pilus assembly protein PilV
MKKKRLLQLNRRGVSLLTALVAMVLMAFAVLGVARVFLQAMKNNGSAGAVQGVMNVAQLVTERVMLLSDTDPLVDGSTPSAAQLGITPGVDYDNALFDFTCTIDSGDIPIGMVRMAKVTVVARYTTAYAQLMGTDPAGSEVRIVSYRYRDDG